MLNFSLTTEQEELRQLARTLAREQLRPQGRSADEQGFCSDALWQTITQTGLTRPFAERYGGDGALDAVTLAIIAEEFGYGDAGLALHILGSLIAPLTIALAGTEEQRQKYISLFCRYEEARGALAFAEPFSAYRCEEITTPLYATVDGLSVRQGIKRNVLHGGSAALTVVLARKAGDLCAFVLPETGWQSVPEEERVGLRAAQSATLRLEQVQIPTHCMLDNTEQVTRAALLYCLLRAGVACGIVRATLDYAGQYAQERVAFGRPIVSYQGIAFLLAEMAMKLDAVRLLLWHAASRWDQEAVTAELGGEIEAVQRQALTLAQKATADGVQILGGAGYIQDHPVELWMRHAIAME
ncbi:acyl-CoA dehydrogenase/hypothetical protein [Thermosporothrix hazakensis]|jgi:alkylation response protein AidB-like acyl-CoA dehydrogenase|uniref:Alkylation response protein AidB-like acyl-CoA dehydrogenase n=2 Tax=Thermosporothrix TaxID=768650 RepID=A0A326UCL7_THEHA|nr:acyl-CoA dehydrogenase family protein [Thermosporothrix hazakensis]PZW36237.1 acyl-CoA dehydrogenase/hypothetical protein [Thermosporothrix hazakensis]BBH88700.1 acyl-CoA dehydrogenase [Thermosporothrix sp. COM3]GCE46886.1 acyl-CoA dehydrogenase [Thermosporothrix hazakensis]